MSSPDSSPAAHTVRIADTSATFACPEDVPVLVAMHALGRSHISVGCRGGGCGVCRIEVVSGTYVTGKMSRAQVSLDEEARGIVLACQVRPRSDLVVRPIG